MNAVTHNRYAEGWRYRRADLQAQGHPVSLGSLVCAGNRRDQQHRAKTVHDFGGVPRKLYELQYPAPGDDPELARRVQELLARLPVKRDAARGFDHGTWSVLRHVYPDADVPVVQLSIDENPARRLSF